MVFAVPLVDIAAYVGAGTDEARAGVARAVDDACRQVGFIQVTGHGVPDHVLAGLASAMDDFFGQDLEAKRAATAPAGSNRGYTAPKSESLSLSLGVESATRMNDFFEAFNVGATAADHPGLDLDPTTYAENVWPDVAGFEDRVQTYAAEGGRVARTLTRIFADALGRPPTSSTRSPTTRSTCSG